MKNVALLGGAFNPIHIGHVQIAESVSKLRLVDEVWVMPCYNSLHNKKMVDPVHRLEMCKIAFKNSDIHVCDFEIKYKLIDSTSEILRKMKVEYPDVHFSFIIGQDNADEIKTWKQYKQLIKENVFIVYPRYNKKIESNSWYLKKPHTLVMLNVSDVSSTQVRYGIRLGSDYPKKNLPEDVLKYVHIYNLYK